MKTKKIVVKRNAKSQKVAIITNEIKLIVDYTKTIEQVISDSNHDWENDDINSKNFPISSEMIGKRVDVSAKLFNFNRSIKSKDVISEMDKAGFRPAVLMELLVLGLLFPKLQKEFPIIALGSVWDGIRDVCYVPSLIVGVFGCELNLSRLNSDWSARCRFLGVKK